MVYQRMVQIGRVVFISSGENSGKLAVIVDVIDGTRALVDGPCSGVQRQPVNFKNVELTKFRLVLRPGARTGKVQKAWEEAKLSEQWKESNWARKIAKRQLRGNMTDLDRFKLMKAKQGRNRIIRTELAKLKKSAAKK